MPSKGVYETCEDMWFKAYVLDATSHRLSDKSHTMYLRITDPCDSVVWFEQYPVYAGRAEGQVYVGDDWRNGDYRVDAFTGSSLGRDTVALMPRRIVVLDNLQSMDSVYAAHASVMSPSERPIQGGLRVEMSVDSALYHTKSRVHVEFQVTDTLGHPVQAELALSVFDWLYHAPFFYDDIVSHYAMPNTAPCGDAFLPDGVSGKLRMGVRRKADKARQPGEQYLNFYAPDGTANFVATAADGSFEIGRDDLAMLPHYFFIKPVSALDLKPEVEMRDAFSEINEATAGRNVVWAHYVQRPAEDVGADTVPAFAGHRTYHLDGIEVTKHVRYPKRDKFYGYLDSISTGYGSAWVCRHAHGDEYLNDYMNGYTHHPNGYGMEVDGPVRVSRPVKGKTYQIVRYDNGVLVDLRTTQYKGELLSEEELLKRNGITKVRGFFPHRSFEAPDSSDIEIGLFDNANTLLWVPSLLTGKDGRASVDFYTSDIASTFYITVNALDGNGALGTAFGSIAVGRD